MLPKHTISEKDSDDLIVRRADVKCELMYEIAKRLFRFLVHVVQTESMGLQGRSVGKQITYLDRSEIRRSAN